MGRRRRHQIGATPDQKRPQKAHAAKGANSRDASQPFDAAAVGLPHDQGLRLIIAMMSCQQMQDALAPAPPL